MSSQFYYSSGQSCLGCKYWELVKCTSPGYKAKWNLKTYCPGFIKKEISDIKGVK